MATAINGTHGGCTTEIMAVSDIFQENTYALTRKKDVCTRKWQIVMISPELILSKHFIKNVLRNPEMMPHILSIVVDEAHVVSHWGSGFRKKYGSLGILRAIIPKGTPFVAMSATLSEHIQLDVLEKLQFKKGGFVDLDISNDRHNVSLVVHTIHNTMNTYSDLDFLIPVEAKDPSEVKRAYIYADQINAASDIEERLYSISPDSFRHAGIIWPYSAAYTSEYREGVMALFKAGIVRILVCTDVAGMVGISLHNRLACK